MAFKPFRATGAEQTEINLTSLIDVSLVLVVMLLLATPLAFESSIAVRRGEQAARKAAERDESARIEIVVHDASRVSVNELDLRIADLGTVLVPLLADAPTAPVVVRCDEGVSHGTFVEVLDEAKASGAVTIAVASTESGARKSPRRG